MLAGCRRRRYSSARCAAPSSRCTASATISSSSMRAREPLAMTAGAGRRARRPAYRHRLRPADRGRAERPPPTHSCGSGTPTAARSRRAATPRAASRRCSARSATIETRGRPARRDARQRRRATVDMGAAALRLGRDPARLSDGHRATAGRLGGAAARPFAVNVGNPHVVFFVDDAGAVDLATGSAR